MVLLMQEGVGRATRAAKPSLSATPVEALAIGGGGRGEIIEPEIGARAATRRARPAPRRPRHSRRARRRRCGRWRGGARRLRARAPRPRAGSTRRGSSRAAIARTASSNSAICVSKASRNRPEMRKVTSTRGRSSSASGRISMPVTRAEPSSQTGRAPMSSSASAKSSPPVRMVALPHTSMTSARGHSPWSCKWRRSSSAAALLGEQHGRARRDRRGDRRRRDCARWAARRRGRASARRRGRG